MAAERQLLDKALARLDDVLAALPQLPPAEDAILAAAAAQAAAKRAKRDPVPEAGIGREGIATPSESDAGSKPRKRKVSISELLMTEPLDEAHYGSAANMARVCKSQACVRRWLAQRVAAKLRKTRTKRHNIIMEMLETEVSYVQKLNGVTEVILGPLEWNAKVSPEPVLPKLMIAEIFSNIRDITELNKTLLHDLEARARTWSATQKIGDVFLELSQHLPLYSTYYNQHDKAIQMLDKALNKHPTFVGFLEQCKNHPDYVNMKLDTLLMEPVQRIPRYVLYLQDFVKVTAPEHPDSQNLKDALASIEGVAADINEKMDEIENTKKVLDIQRKISGDFETLVAPKRKFLRNGPLLKCKLDKNIFTSDVDQVHLFLFSDLLLVTAKTVGTYVCKALVPLQSNLVRLKPVADMTLVQNVFYLITPTRTFTFMGKDPDEKEDWMAELNRCIKGGNAAAASSSADSVQRLDVTILGSEVRNEAKKSFTVYKLLVQNEQLGVEHVVWRRYSEFDQLKKRIKKTFPNEVFANLPRKHIVGNLNNDVIEARRIMLERYLQEIIMNPLVLESELVREFLQSDRVKGNNNKA